MSTDDELREMERYLRKQYQRAGKEVLAKAEEYFKKFESLDKQKQKQVESGKLTEEEYKTWRRNKILYGEHWDKLMNQITGELYKTNQAAAAYVEGKSVKIFAENFNLVEKEIPETPVKGYTFELVNEETVRQLATTGELMLPPPNPPDKYKDNKWNAKQVHAEVLQGILQGDSMNKIASRLMNTVDKNHVSAIRNARTMVTAAENSGRQAGFDKAEKDGIIFKKEWIATPEPGRTRASHLAINGELIDNEATFSNGCRFPGDWLGDPSEVYNCRCTLGSRFVGFVKKKLEEAAKTQEEPKEKQAEKNEGKYELSPKVLDFIDKTFASQKEITDEDIELLKKHLIENPTEGKLFEKYALNMKWEYCNTGTGQSFGKSGLEYHLDSNKERSRFSTFFHEFGHSLDYSFDDGRFTNNEADVLHKLQVLFAERTNKISASDAFLEAMRKDKESVLKLIYSSDTPREVTKDLFYRSVGMQDFITGIAGNDDKIRKRIDFGHSEKHYNETYNYAKDHYSVAEMKKAYKEVGIEIKNANELKDRMRAINTACEAWANLNEEFANGESDIMQRYCPNMYEFFVNAVEEYANE